MISSQQRRFCRTHAADSKARLLEPLLPVYTSSAALLQPAMEFRYNSAMPCRNYMQHSEGRPFARVLRDVRSRLLWLCRLAEPGCAHAHAAARW